jgi:predicted branched-subunit amino acid permease
MALTAGMVAAPLYLALASHEIDRHSGPRWWSYALAVAAFLSWALATSPPTAHLLGVDQKLAGMMLAVAALFIPALDLLLTPCSSRRRARPRARRGRRAGLRSALGQQ